MLRREAPFVIFCSGQAGYFLQLDVDKVLDLSQNRKEKAGGYNFVKNARKRSEI